MENKYLKYKQKYLNFKSIGGLGDLNTEEEEEQRILRERRANPSLHLIDLERDKKYYETSKKELDAQLLKLRKKYESEQVRIMKEYEKVEEHIKSIDAEIIVQKKLITGL